MKDQNKIMNQKYKIMNKILQMIRKVLYDKLKMN